MTAQPALLHTQSFNPFDVQQDHAYAIWRDWKLEHAPSRLEQLLVEVSNPMQLTPAEQEALLSRCSHTNMALYACDPQQWQKFPRFWVRPSDSRTWITTGLRMKMPSPHYR